MSRHSRGFIAAIAVIYVFLLFLGLYSGYDSTTKIDIRKRPQSTVAGKQYLACQAKGSSQEDCLNQVYQLNYDIPCPPEVIEKLASGEFQVPVYIDSIQVYYDSILQNFATTNQTGILSTFEGRTLSKILVTDYSINRFQFIKPELPNLEDGVQDTMLRYQYHHSPATEESVTVLQARFDNFFVGKPYSLSMDGNFTEFSQRAYSRLIEAGVKYNMTFDKMAPPDFALSYAYKSFIMTKFPRSVAYNDIVNALGIRPPIAEDEMAYQSAKQFMINMFYTLPGFSSITDGGSIYTEPLYDVSLLAIRMANSILYRSNDTAATSLIAKLQSIVGSIQSNSTMTLDEIIARENIAVDTMISVASQTRDLLLSYQSVNDTEIKMIQNTLQSERPVSLLSIAMSKSVNGEDWVLPPGINSLEDKLFLRGADNFEQASVYVSTLNEWILKLKKDPTMEKLEDFRSWIRDDKPKLNDFVGSLENLIVNKVDHVREIEITVYSELQESILKLNEVHMKATGKLTPQIIDAFLIKSYGEQCMDVIKTSERRPKMEKWSNMFRNFRNGNLRFWKYFKTNAERIAVTDKKTEAAKSAYEFFQQRMKAQEVLTRLRQLEARERRGSDVFMEKIPLIVKRGQYETTVLQPFALLFSLVPGTPVDALMEDYRAPEIVKSSDVFSAKANAEAIFYRGFEMQSAMYTAILKGEIEYDSQTEKLKGSTAQVNQWLAELGDSPKVIFQKIESSRRDRSYYDSVIQEQKFEKGEFETSVIENEERMTEEEFNKAEQKYLDDFNKGLEDVINEEKEKEKEREKEEEKRIAEEEVKKKEKGKK